MNKRKAIGRVDGSYEFCIGPQREPKRDGRGTTNIVLIKFGEYVLFLLFALVPTAALYFLPPDIHRPLYIDAKAEAIALTIAWVCLRMLGFMQLTTTLCLLTRNSLQDVVVFVLLSSNAMFILVTTILPMGSFKNGMGRPRSFLYTSMLHSVQTDILTGKSLVDVFVLVTGMYMLLPLFLALPNFRKKELSF